MICVTCDKTDIHSVRFHMTVLHKNFCIVSSATRDQASGYWSVWVSVIRLSDYQIIRATEELPLFLGREEAEVFGLNEAKDWLARIDVNP